MARQLGLHTEAESGNPLRLGSRGCLSVSVIPHPTPDGGVAWTERLSRVDCQWPFVGSLRSDVYDALATGQADQHHSQHTM